MPYIVVENFKGGLDSRRSSLVSAPGSMLVAENVHVTRGAELEKRKAFVPFADVPNAFGMETTSEGLVVFKSINNNCIEVIPGSVPEGYEYAGMDENGLSWGCPIPPEGVIFQYLNHPDGANLVGVPFSTVYGGKTFAIAAFDNGDQIPFFNGVAIKAFTNGYSTGAMGSLANFAEHLKEIIQDQINQSQAAFNANEVSNDPMKDYSVTRSGNIISITGEPTIDFAVKAYGEAPITATVTTLVNPKEAIGALQAEATFTIANGSDGSAGIDFGFRYIDAASLPGITGIYVKGTSTAVADGDEITGLATTFFYNSLPSPGFIAHDPGQLLGWGIKELVNGNSGSNELKCTYDYNGGNWSGLDPAYIFITTSDTDGASFNNEYMHIEFAADPTGVASLGELVNVSTITVSPYDPTRFIAQARATGQFNGGSTNCITSVMANGTELIDGPVYWVDSNDVTKVLLINAINANCDTGLTHGYKANAGTTSPGRVTIVHPSDGAAANGQLIKIRTAGSVLVTNLTTFQGGRDAVSAVSKVVQVTLGGSLSPGKTAWIMLTDPERPSLPYKFGATRVSGLGAAANVAESGGFCLAFTYKYKVYVAIGSTLYFSAINDATKWDVFDTGSGFIDMSNNFGGRERITGAGVYQNSIAIFTERNCQLWFLDPDPNKNAQQQVLDNTGSIAPDTVISVGSVDCFYLSYNGVRSLKSRDSTDTAYSNDIGSPIDETIVEHLRTLDDDERYAAKAVIEPEDGRYWISVGGRLFVLSAFQGSGISAWSEYVPGFEVSDLVVHRRRVYIRSGDQIYLYGGEAGDEYDDCHVDVELPYLDGNKPGTFKSVNGIDATCEGEWVVSLGFDYTNPTARDEIATITQPTFALGSIPATGLSTHVGVKLTSDFNGYCRLANLLVHYDLLHSKHEAG